MGDAIQCLGYLAGLLPPTSQTSLAERELLKRYANGKSSLAEVGIYRGLNTKALLDAAAPNAIVYGIDPFIRGRFGCSFNRVIATRHARTPAGKKMVWVREFSPDAFQSPLIPPGVKFDFVFIDGDHSYEGLEKDWLACTRRLDDDAIVALHDSIGDPTMGSVRYCQEQIVKHPNVSVVDTVDTLTVVRWNRCETP